jgi:hypothetical protein
MSFFVVFLGLFSQSFGIGRDNRLSDSYLPTIRHLAISFDAAWAPQLMNIVKLNVVVELTLLSVLKAPGSNLRPEAC